MPAVPFPLDDAGYLAADLSCAACEYNLRGMRPDDRCPECGTAVADALVGNPLALADPAWRKRVRRGLLLLAVIASCAAFKPLLYILLPLLMGSGASAWTYVAWLPWAMGIPGWILFLVGLWWVTAPDPRPLVEDRRNVRLAARLLSVAGAALWLLAWIWGGIAAARQQALIPYYTLSICGAIAASGGVLVLLYYLVWLRRRAPAGRKAWLPRIVLGMAWCALVLQVVYSICVVLYVATLQYNAVFQLTAISSIFWTLVFNVCQAIFLLNLRRHVPRPEIA